jgi:gentisate 1,2-dioxygenase
MPTIGCYVQMLRPGERTAAHRHTATTIYHVIEGEGATIADGRRLEWTDKDVVCVPSWTVHEHVNLSPGRPAVLFSYTDAPVLRALDLYREAAHAAGNQSAQTL